MASDDPARGLSELLSALRSDSPAAAAPPGPVPAAAAPGAVPASATAPELKEFLLRRIAELERGLAQERERASAAETRGVLQQANRDTVEEQLRSISELLRRERDESHSRGRIEALEARLDKMHEAWAAALEKPAQGNSESASVLARTLEARLDKQTERTRAELELVAKRLFDLGQIVDLAQRRMVSGVQVLARGLERLLDAVCRGRGGDSP